MLVMLLLTVLQVGVTLINLRNSPIVSCDWMELCEQFLRWKGRVFRSRSLTADDYRNMYRLKSERSSELIHHETAEGQ